MNFDAAFDHVLSAEGGYQAARNDPGNWTGGKVDSGELRGTAWGISAASYPDLDIIALTVEDAKRLYERDYWRAGRCDALPDPIDLVHFDCAVNQGVRTAAFLLQRALNVTVDGMIGPVTLAAARSASPRLLAEEYLWARADRYAQLARERRSSERFLPGWVLRLVRLRDAALEVA